MITKVNALAEKLEQAVRDFTDVAVVGISGGIDSAVVASVSVAALGPKNVYVVSMPYDELDVNTFNLRSTELAEKLQAHHLTVAIGASTDALLSAVRTGYERLGVPMSGFHRLTNGNTRARIRMTVLYGLCGELSYRFQEEAVHDHIEPVHGQSFVKRVRVMGTGNASEDLIGYDTKGGDALADIFILGDLFKSEVYQLARHYEVPASIIQAPPSAGLYEGQTDQAELGFTYEELEPALAALHRCLSRGVKDEELSLTLKEFQNIEKRTAEFVIRRFRANAHKHRAPVVVPVRHTDLVKDIWAA